MFLAFIVDQMLPHGGYRAAGFKEISPYRYNPNI
jgi:hypothetical protein